MKKHLSILLSSLIYLYSCNSEEKTIINIETLAKDEVSSFFKGYKYVCLETNQYNLIHNIDKIQIDDDTLWVLDQRLHTIYAFDYLGKYMHKLNHWGNGPEEYMDIADFQIVNGNIYVLSRTDKKIYRYETAGKFIESYKLNNYYDYFYITTEGTILLYSNFSNNELHNLVVYNPQSNIYENKFLPFPSNQSFSFSPSPFNVSNDNEILLSQQYDYTIYSVNAHSVKSIATLSFDSKDQLPEKIFEKDFFEMYKELQLKSVVKRFDYVNKNKDLIDIIYILDYQPHLTRINTNTGENKTLKLEYNEETPYIFGKSLGFANNYLITYLSAFDVLKFDANFKINETLNEENNPVLFFNELINQ